MQQLISIVLRLLAAILGLCIFFSCSKTTTTNREKDRIFPVKLAVNGHPKYKINQTTKDTIKAPFDSLMTGIPIELYPDTIPAIPESITTPKGKPDSLSLEPPATTLNISDISYSINTIKFNSPSLKDSLVEKITPQKDTFKLKHPKTRKAKKPSVKKEALTQIKYIDISHNLTTTDVIGMAEDEHGQIYISSNGTGLELYDGNVWKEKIRHKDFLLIRNIYVENENDIWCSSEQNLLHYFNHILYTYKLPDIDLFITDIQKDKVGNIWMTTSNGIIMFDGENFHRYFSNYKFSGLHIDRENNVWTLSKKKLIAISNYAFTEYNFDSYLTSITASNNDVLYLSMPGKGVIEFDTKSTSSVLYESPEALYGLKRSKKGTIWAFNNKGEVIQLKNKSLKKLNANIDLSNYPITQTLLTQSGAFWISKHNYGIEILDQTSFNHYNIFDKNKKVELNNIITGHNNITWVSTSMGLYKIKNNKVHIYSEENGLDVNCIFMVFEDSKKNLWLAGENQLVKFDGEHYYYFTKSFNYSMISSAYEDSKGNIWFGKRNGGVVKYDGNNFISYKELDSGYEGCWSIFEDHKKNLWISTWGKGLVKYNEDKFTFYTPYEGLASFHIKDVVQDEDNKLWISTEAGINIWHNDTIETLQSDNYVNIGVDSWHLLKDRKKNIWMVSMRGITCYNKLKIALAKYWYEDGIGAQELGWASHIDPNNKLWYSSIKGLSSLNLNEVNYAKQPPKLYLTSIKANEERILPDSVHQYIEYDSFDYKIGVPGNIKLAYDYNQVSFNFSATDWKSSSDFQYSFKLNDEDWTTPKNNSSFERILVIPGKYTLKARVKGSYEYWSKPITIQFTILPPWWLTYYAFAGYILILVGIYYLLIQVKTRRAKKYQKELETTIAERTRELNFQKERTEGLLHNILPEKIAGELIKYGINTPEFFKDVTVLFTDFKGFTELSEKLSTHVLLEELNDIFRNFDQIIDYHGIEKIKTIGDAYMAVGGAPEPIEDHAIKTVNAAQAILKYLNKRNKTHKIQWEMRIGIHTGPVAAGVVGLNKFTYDIFGDTVNTASRIESAGNPGKINISCSTYELVKDHFKCTPRGELHVKGKGELPMYFIE